VAHGLLWPMMALSLFIGWPDNKLYAYRNDLFRPFCQICPGKRLFPLVGGNGGCVFAVDSLSPLTQALSCLSLAALGAFLTGPFLVRRFWCRVCPLGLLCKLSGLNRFSLAELRKDAAACTACGECAAACPVDVSLVRGRREADVTAAECDLCLECVTACPEPNVLQARFFGLPVYRSQGRDGNMGGDGGDQEG
jgi:Pyruvate/2-oxoacid:ferredoxin oxidoreductase delta subunit